MGYQVNYQTSGKVRRISGKRKRIQICFVVLCFCGALGAIFWAGRDEVMTTIAALDLMAMELGQGSSMKEAFTAFCLQVLQGA